MPFPQILRNILHPQLKFFFVCLFVLLQKYPELKNYFNYIKVKCCIHVVYVINCPTFAVKDISVFKYYFFMISSTGFLS